MSNKIAMPVQSTNLKNYHDFLIISHFKIISLNKGEAIESISKFFLSGNRFHVTLPNLSILFQ